MVANQLAIIGEIGLDKAAVDYETKEKFNWDHQVEIFVAQMELAVKLQRPVSVHSVQSHGFLLEYFQKLETTCKAAYAIDPTTLPCPPSIMLHSFSASKEVLQSLIRLKTIGCRFYFSFSHTINSKTLKKTFERIVATPETQLLIESDVHNVLDVPVAMQNAVDMVATAKSWNHQKVVEVTTRNALRFLQRL